MAKRKVSSDEAAFREAIIADPDDDAPRLVYADWLEEHGDAEYAEFIRVQCELARRVEAMFTAGETTWEGIRRRWLWSRVDALIGRNEAAWKSRYDLPAVEWTFEMSLRGIEFHRGLPGIARFYSVEDFEKVADALFSAAPIQEFHFFEKSYRVGLDLNRLANSRHLVLARRLSVSGGDHGDEMAILVARSPHLRNLRHLEFWSIGPEGAKAIADSPHLTELRQLDLKRNPIQDAGAVALAGSRHLARLAVLDLSYCEIGEDGARALAASPYLNELLTLQLGQQGNHGVRAAGAEALIRSPYLPKLRRLELPYNKLGVEGAKLLAEAPELTKLRTLDLGHNHLRASGVKTLATSPHLAGLVELDLRGNSLGDRGAAEMAKLPPLPNLKKLNLFSNQIGADGARALTGAAFLASLEDLDLSYHDHFGDAGARALAASPHLSNLIRLSLNCCQIGPPGLQALLESPHLRNLQALEGIDLPDSGPLREEYEKRFGRGNT